MSPITTKEMTDDEIQWHQERLDQFEKMLKCRDEFPINSRTLLIGGKVYSARKPCG